MLFDVGIVFVTITRATSRRFILTCIHCDGLIASAVVFRCVVADMGQDITTIIIIITTIITIIIIIIIIIYAYSVILCPTKRPGQENVVHSVLLEKRLREGAQTLRPKPLNPLTSRLGG